MLKQSSNKLLCFCEKKSSSLFLFFMTTSIDLLSLQDSFLLRTHSYKTLCTTQYLCLFMEEHSVWFSSVLLFFHRLLELCNYCSNNFFCWGTSRAFLDAPCVIALVLTPLLCQPLPTLTVAVFPLLRDHNSSSSFTVRVAKIASFRWLKTSLNSQ